MGETAAVRRMGDHNAFIVDFGAERFRVHFGATIAQRPRVFACEGRELKREVARRSDLYKRIINALAAHLWG